MSAGTGDGPYDSEPGPVGTRFVEVRRFAELDSTNRYLADVARVAPVSGLVAVADHQTAGRGRLGRRWEAPPDANLLVSVLLVPTLPVSELHWCSVAVALAAAEACRRSVGLEPDLKWPNDLVVGARKLGGVLAESVPVTGGAVPEEGPEGQPRGHDALHAVVVGIGVNVRWPPAGDERSSPPVPTDLQDSATSIARETGADVDRRFLLDLLLEELEPRLVQLDDPRLRPRLLDEYRERCSTIGQRVRVSSPQGEVTGTAVGVTPEGHLTVDTGSGLTTIAVGDVVHVRPGR